MKQALEWGETGTPPHHWDQLVAIRGSLSDLKHNLRTLLSIISLMFCCQDSDMMILFTEVNWNLQIESSV